MKTLILYYSQAVGNTEKVANMIGSKLDADMEKIDTIVPYKGSYSEISEQGRKEVEEGYMPPIKNINSDVTKYERIIIATPTWWYTMAPAIKTLLSKIDLTDKEVVLVQTHAGWPGTCIDDMKKMIKGNVISTISIQFDSSGGTTLITPIKEINEWINNL